jgi:predicted nucleotidyltransferase
MLNTPLRNGLLQTLAYYDVFSYPLTLLEIHEKLPVRATLEEVKDCMHDLLMDGRVYHFDNFYTLRNDYGLVQKRRTANVKANEQMELARQKASFISKFPFIRGIFISGSLSKNYADDKSDLDFFIVTAPGHLWLARTIFVFMRKLLVARKHYRNYCLNYFVTSDNLRIEEQNLFTATELTTLIPVFGHKYYVQILDSNQWLRSLLPNFKMKEMDFPPDTTNSVKNLFENIFGIFGKRTERFLMNLTMVKLSRQHSNKFSKEDFAIAIKAREGISKVHIGHNQKRILDLYESRVRELQPFFEATPV